MKDEDYMGRAIELATKGKGHTSPNPLVGTVIVKNDRIIGEGYHKKFGEKHAEIMAIDTAREPVEGSTLFCNLEPCTNNIPNKKTPPCTDRIIREKIKRVVIATSDPNPYVNGDGIRRLQENNIQVDIGPLQDQAIQLNEKYFVYHKFKRPFIHLKIAQSLDGRIATTLGKSKWITNENAKNLVFRLRSENDAVLVGIKTVLQDDPLLTVRNIKGQNPVRIILDNELIIPPASHVLSLHNGQKTLIFAAQPHERSRIKTLEDLGAEVIIVDAQESKYLNLHEVLRQLYLRGISSVLVEGGSEVFTSFIKQKLFDKITFFISPMLIGTGIQSIGNLGIESLENAYRLENVTINIIDNQAVMEGYRDYQSIIG